MEATAQCFVSISTSIFVTGRCLMRQLAPATPIPPTGHVAPSPSCPAWSMRAFQLKGPPCGLATRMRVPSPRNQHTSANPSNKPPSSTCLPSLLLGAHRYSVSCSQSGLPSCIATASSRLECEYSKPNKQTFLPCGAQLSKLLSPHRQPFPQTSSYGAPSIP